MIFPPEINQKIYASVFNMSIQSSTDGSIAYGRFLLPASERRNLEEQRTG